jgi:hypothetical protein
VRRTALILTGHIPSEGFVKEVPVGLVAAAEPFRVP